MEMKENIKLALLGVLTLTMVYSVFIKEEAPRPRKTFENANQTTPQVNQQNAFNPTIGNTTPQQAVKPAEPAKPVGPTTSVNFAQMSHSFGNIKQDTENKHVFKFTNTGDNPLIIESASGSCGCTVPEYPKEPIAPGEEGEIKVVYKPGKQKGNQNKTVTLIANTEPRETRLSISAVVEEVQ